VESHTFIKIMDTSSFDSVLKGFGVETPAQLSTTLQRMVEMQAAKQDEEVARLAEEKAVAAKRLQDNIDLVSSQKGAMAALVAEENVDLDAFNASVNKSLESDPGLIRVFASAVKRSEAFRAANDRLAAEMAETKAKYQALIDAGAKYQSANDRFIKITPADATPAPVAMTPVAATASASSEDQAAYVRRMLKAAGNDNSFLLKKPKVMT
jgi:hypothetical protein